MSENNHDVIPGSEVNRNEVLVNDAKHFGDWYYFENIYVNQLIAGEGKPHKFEEVYVYRDRGVKQEGRQISNFTIMPLLPQDRNEQRRSPLLADEHGMKHPIIAPQTSEDILVQNVLFIWDKMLNLSLNTKIMNESTYASIREDVYEDFKRSLEIIVKYRIYPLEDELDIRIEKYSKIHDILHDKVVSHLPINTKVDYASKISYEKNPAAFVPLILTMIEELTIKFPNHVFIEDTDQKIKSVIPNSSVNKKTNRESKNNFNEEADIQNPIIGGSLGNANEYRILKHEYSSKPDRIELSKYFSDLKLLRNLGTGTFYTNLMNLFCIHRFFIEINFPYPFLYPIEHDTRLHWHTEIPEGLRICAEKTYWSLSKFGIPLDLDVDTPEQDIEIEGSTFMLQYNGKLIQKISDDIVMNPYPPRASATERTRNKIIYDLICKEQLSLMFMSWLPVYASLIFGIINLLIWNEPSAGDLIDLATAAVGTIVSIGIAVAIIVIYQFELRKPIFFRFILSLVLIILFTIIVGYSDAPQLWGLIISAITIGLTAMLFYIGLIMGEVPINIVKKYRAWRTRNSHHKLELMRLKSEDFIASFISEFLELRSKEKIVELSILETKLIIKELKQIKRLRKMYYKHKIQNLDNDILVYIDESIRLAEKEEINEITLYEAMELIAEIKQYKKFKKVYIKFIKHIKSNEANSYIDEHIREITPEKFAELSLDEAKELLSKLKQLKLYYKKEQKYDKIKRKIEKKRLRRQKRRKKKEARKKKIVAVKRDTKKKELAKKETEKKPPAKKKTTSSKKK